VSRRLAPFSTRALDGAAVLAVVFLFV